MILKNTLGLVIASMVLVGCSQVPLEHREPYAVVEVNKPAKEVYESLTAYPYCGVGWNVHGSFNDFDGSFAIRYAFSGFLSEDGAADLITGKTVGANTRLTLRSIEKWQTPISEKFLNRLQTGNCK